MPGDSSADPPQCFFCQPEDETQVGEGKVLYLVSNGRGFFCPLAREGAAEAVMYMSSLRDSLDDSESYLDEVVSVLPKGIMKENFRRMKLALAAAVTYSTSATSTTLTADSTLIKEFSVDKKIQARPSMQLVSGEGRTRRALKATGGGTAPPPAKIQRMECECYCGKKCTDEDDLQRHISTEHKDNWACSICDQVLSGAAALWKHVRCTHQKKYLYTCQYCTFGSDTWANIPKHVSLSHKDEEPLGEMITCPKCHGTFSSKSALTRHLPGCGHADKTYKCEEENCGKMFRSKENLKSHIEAEHKSHKRQCPYCKKEYVHKASLNTHILAEHPKSKKGLELIKKQKKK